ncbi:hypothetical protein HDU97_007442 [Phlyctochytrium planicorne]|nr:hypothetical protein HDU97_007442 [Phlyctochytrium planicorne]
MSSPTPSTSSSSTTSSVGGLRFQQALLLQKQQVEQEDEQRDVKIFGPFVETVTSHYMAAKKYHDPLNLSLIRSLKHLHKSHPDLLKPGSAGLFPLSNSDTAPSNSASASSSQRSTPHLHPSVLKKHHALTNQLVDPPPEHPKHHKLLDALLGEKPGVYQQGQVLGAGVGGGGRVGQRSGQPQGQEVEASGGKIRFAT